MLANKEAVSESFNPRDQSRTHRTPLTLIDVSDIR